ncbi:hypothetical protein SUGI_0277310 [Cryptomeria japonica]|uniref:TITAN-like protein n=1 Tax=Cryptomeria japonica TaxID=3369 RepID=UPI002408CDCB|nr:TITAN-like protein [Cryptomeria japonica]GLJ16366.1 hypothetical protein SUGI_0277310 [Cryptomeria japonica]
MSTAKQFALCKICRLNHNKGKGHKYSLNHKKRLAEILSKFLKKIEDVVYFVKNPTPLHPQFQHRNNFWCVVCEEEIHEMHSFFACCNTIKHLTSTEHMECLRSFWVENGADVQKRDKYCISQQDFTKWENGCRSLERMSMPSGGCCYEDINNIHFKHSSIYMGTIGNVSVNTITNNLSDSVLPLQYFKDKNSQVSSQGDIRASVAHLASQDAHFSGSSRINANHAPLWKHAQESNNKQLLSKKRLVHAGATAGDCVAQNHAVSTSSASSEQPWLGSFPRHEEGYNVACSLQDGHQGIEHHLTCIRAPYLIPGEVKENIHTGAPPPWLKVDGENEVISSGTSGTSADIQRLSKTQERKLKKMRNPKRVGAAWAERRRVELKRELNGDIPSTSVANDSSWLPNFGRVWQAGSRKDSMKEFEAEKNHVTKTKNLVELQPYVSKRKRLDPMNKSMTDGN